MAKQILIKLMIGVSIFLSSFALAENSNEPEISVYTQDHPAAIVNPKQPYFIIKLKSNPTTGYSWFLRDFNSDMLQPISHSFAPPDTKLVGAPGFELWKFRMKPAAFLVPQQTLIRFVYTRPWEAAESPTPVIFKIATAEGAHK